MAETTKQTLYSEKEVTLADATEHGLTEEEFEKIREYLGGRNPTVTELGIYSGMWSEHCSYKNSILMLKTLPSDSPRSLAKAGDENAGAIDIGDGLAVVFKIESHNHPTAVEPYQGAATGVGGIMRDIFTMGARPICSLNSLRFGYPTDSRSAYLLKRAVAGIGDYGNSLGVAVSGGEILFDESYTRNCLVNAMTVGVVEHSRMATASAGVAGQPVFYVGATTGRDGIHGASFASRDLSEESESKRSAVQVGDPFMEKLLLEATLELIGTGAIHGIQDMGAAGLSCSTSEMSAKAGLGMNVNLDLVPLREDGMNAYEIMLSESQERMLVVAKKGQEQTVIDIFEKWDLHAVEIGETTEDGMIRVHREGKLCSMIPADSLVLGGGAPRYKRETKRPAYMDQCVADTFDYLKPSDDLTSDFLELVSSYNIASKRPVFEQYDTEVGLVRVQGPGSDGGVARIPGTQKGIATSADCNSRYVYLEPKQGAKMAVYESARNVAVVGAEPLGVTNCLNFPNPYIPENYYLFAESVTGLGDACRKLEIPVTGGNVSFYNESPDGPVLPTPTIGMVGLVEDVTKTVPSYFKQAGDSIYLIGNFQPSFGGSEYLKIKTGRISGKLPDLNEEEEVKLIRFLTEAGRAGLHQSARDLSIGGLATALFRSSYNSDTKTVIGFKLNAGISTQVMKNVEDLRPDLFWFGESNSAALVSVATADQPAFEKLAGQSGVEIAKIGETTQVAKGQFGDFEVDLTDAAKMFEASLQPFF